MKSNFVRGSLLLFVLSIVLWFMVTLFESALVGLSLSVERVITLLALVLLPAVGAVMGMMSLFRKEGRTALAVTGIILNTLFALFHAVLVLFAG